MTPQTPPDPARYAVLLETPSDLRDEWFPNAGRRPVELEIQARWFAGDFGRSFFTEDGRRAEIVQMGVWNRESGPDFIGAAVSFDGGEPVHGGIELDLDARDWERHGHATNPAYEGVQLHVFTRKAGPVAFARTASHRAVPQVYLDLSAQPSAHPRAVLYAKPGRCSAPLASMRPEALRELIAAAAMHRMSLKAARIARWSAWHGPDEALFQALAETLGYKHNTLPFLALAQRLTLRGLRRKGATAEARLFGCSGFLEGSPPDDLDPPARDHVRALWSEWWRERSECGRLMLAPSAWKLGGVRPANHPQRRIAALAALAKQWPKLRALSESGDLAALRRWLGALEHPFWSTRFTLHSKPAPKPLALLGPARIGEMFANAFIPLALRSRLTSWDAASALRAAEPNREVKTAAARLFAEAHVPEIATTLVGQQGLQQIYRDFCLRDASDCARCRFPEIAARFRSRHTTP